MAFTDFPSVSYNTELTVFGQVLTELHYAFSERWNAVDDYLQTRDQGDMAFVYGIVTPYSGGPPWFGSGNTFDHSTTLTITNAAFDVPYVSLWGGQNYRLWETRELTYVDFEGTPTMPWGAQYWDGPGNASCPWVTVIQARRYWLPLMVSDWWVREGWTGLRPDGTIGITHYRTHHVQFVADDDSVWDSVDDLVSASGYGAWNDDRAREQYPFVLRQLTDVVSLIPKFRYKHEDPVTGNEDWSYHSIALTYG